jgi:hypothetical protein
MPITAATTLQFFWRDGYVPTQFRAGVSLHSHTMYSEESLLGAMRFISSLPYLRRAIRRQEAEYCGTHGVSVDLQHGFWTPPLSPRQAYRLEQKQIEERLQLPALVSLTDHDDIRAGRQLSVLPRFSKAPVSIEWTVPFSSTFFHLGVHNLPDSHATRIAQDLAAYTEGPTTSELARLLDALNAHPRVLIVLNHPLWDEKRIGREEHLRVLASLLDQCGQWIHALELNGLRSMQENLEVLRMGADRNMPVVAGGDRHGLEPNALLNLSCAETLSGFIDEIRRRRSSHVVFMPQYRQPQILRIIHAIVDVLRDYPDNLEGRRTFPDRVFYRHPETGTPVPFGRVCGTRGTNAIRHFITALRVMDRRPPSVILTSA